MIKVTVTMSMSMSMVVVVVMPTHGKQSEEINDESHRAHQEQLIRFHLGGIGTRTAGYVNRRRCHRKSRYVHPLNCFEDDKYRY